VLPVVAAASIISGLGIALGLIALIVPGIILTFRWVVVAQAAAIEHEGWLPALRRSRQLTAGHYRHIFVFIIYVGLIITVPTLLVGFGFGHHCTTAASFMARLIVRIFTNSFGALTAALLYYDLRVRWESSTEEAVSGDLALPSDTQQGAKQHVDPRKYSDLGRPKGWYIDPDDPGRMRYWTAGDSPGWEGTTRTPRKIRRAWETEDLDP
jgi:hypothetical protein